MQEMFNNKNVINTTGVNFCGENFSNDFYWSSTQTDINNAEVFNLSTGTIDTYDKSTNCRVRAIRMELLD